MIGHKTFTEHADDWTALTPLDRREKVRQEAEQFLNHELPTNVHILDISETATAIGGLFAVTVWYREPERPAEKPAKRVHLRPEEESAELLERMIHGERPADPLDLLVSAELVRRGAK